MAAASAMSEADLDVDTEESELQVFGGEATAAPVAGGSQDGYHRAAYNDYLGSIAELPIEEVDVFNISRCFEKIGLDFSDPDTKLEWHKEVRDVIGLLERCIIDGTASIKRLLSALEQYDSGKMTVELEFPSSVETRPIEKGIREPAHALKGAAATISMDRLALACRAVEHPLKAAADEAEAAGKGDAERRATIDRALGPKRELVTALCSRVQEALDFMADELLEQMLLHRCGIADPDAAREYIPTAAQLAAGATMPPNEPLDYNNDDWCDDLDDVTEDVDDFVDKFPEGWLQSALEPHTMPA